MDIPNQLFAVHVASTLYMTGLIWFVQLAHYPLMAKVGPEKYTDYQQAHMKHTTWAVGPAMLGEVATALALLFFPCEAYPPLLGFLGIGLLALVWLSTAALQVPAHSILVGGFSPEAHRRLVNTNWIRTLGWSARALLVLSALVQALP
jgi:uncharacterized membrane protein